MARVALFIDENNNPLPGINIDPTIGTPEYETGIPIVEPAEPVTMDSKRGIRGRGSREGEEITEPVLKPGWHCNVRISGEREQQEIEGLAQIDENGNLLSASQRTHFGITFTGKGTVATDDTTEGVVYLNVALIDETSVVSPQRVWQ